MGYRVAWIARSGTSTQELLQLSDRPLTGERHEFPDVGWYLLELPSSARAPWVLLIADGSENFSDLDASQAQALSRGGHETLHFWCSDTVMVTELVCFKNGKEEWSVEYDCGNEMKRPAMNGRVPPVAHEILDRLQQQQQVDSGADYLYDITAELGRSLVGFRHDTDLEIEDPEPFQVLGKPVKLRRAWWRIWNR